MTREPEEITTIQLELERDRESLENATLIDRLKMTYEERVEAHENALRLFEDLKTIGEAERAKSQGAS
jgi:hypothetical protein